MTARQLALVQMKYHGLEHSRASSCFTDSMVPLLPRGHWKRTLITETLGSR